MKKEKSYSVDATSKQGAGVENIVEQNAKVPNMDSQADIKAADSRSDAGAINSYDAKKEKTKTHLAAEVVTGSSGSTGSAGSLLRGVAFGGSAGNKIGNDVSATTKADNVYRSGQRMGKRLDPITRKIDFNYPELVKVDIRQSKPLSETDEKQGYNGEYVDEHAITQKVSGGAPGDPLFNRSVDMITCDMAYYADGQYNKSKDVTYDEYAAANWNGSTYDSTVSTLRGSYMPKDLTVTFNAKGAVGFVWTEDDLSNRNLDEATVRLAGDAALRTVNQRELDRLEMVNQAGNESESGYSPLGDAVKTATAVNTILADVDAIAGDNIFMSERKIAQALAWQINKAAKDGIRVKGPMAEMLNGNIEGQYSTALGPVSEENGISYAFNKTAYAAGGAGLWLAINDSLTKYTTKGKLLTLPLSFKNALNIAKANDAEFRMHSQLFNDVRHCELFSTIDGGYDPFMPVVMTDKANVINSMSLYDTASVTIDADTTVGDNVFPSIFTYHYENLRNKWNIPVYNFFAYGLFKFFRANASRFRDNLTESSGIWTLTIPIQSSATSLSLWDLVVCSAVPYMVTLRQESLVDVIKYQAQHGYPYSGLQSLAETSIDDAINYSFVDTESPLNTKIANPVDAIKIKFPEVFWPVGCKAFDDHVKGGGHGFMATDTVLPHYFNQEQFKVRNSTDGALVLSENDSVISYPSVRSGCELTDLDTIYGMSEEDYRLALDRMVVYPAYDRILPITASSGTSDIDHQGSTVFKYNWSTVGTNHYEIEPAKAYKYGLTGDGVPVLPYLATAEATAEADRCLTIYDVMHTPRELGLHFVVPSGVLTPVQGATYANFRNTASGYLAVSGPGFTAYMYKAQGKSMEDDILSNANYAIARNASYLNDYIVYQTIPNNADTDFGFVFSVAKNMKATAADHTYALDGGSFDFVPFTINSYGDWTYSADSGTYSGGEEQATSTSGQLDVVSFQKYFWTRLQRLPFVINPFDSNSSDLSYTESGQNHGNKYDIYDFMYFFGFCGFRASDFKELTYERNRDRIAYGMNYVNDPYIEKTMLLK